MADLRKLQFKAVALGTAAAATTVAVGTAFALQPDPRLQSCLQDDPSRQVEASFGMSRARDYKLHVPKMGISPELDTDDQAFVVVFRGPVKLPAAQVAPPAVDANGDVIAGANIQPGVASGVVCIVVRGRPNFYVNVDSSGLAK